MPRRFILSASLIATLGACSLAGTGNQVRLAENCLIDPDFEVVLTSATAVIERTESCSLYNRFNEGAAVPTGMLRTAALDGTNSDRDGNDDGGDTGGGDDGGENGGGGGDGGGGGGEGGEPNDGGDGGGPQL